MSKQKNTAGGSATERGMDFQARVSAIVLTCLITEKTLSWIEDNPTIIPINCQAETGGSGDDIAFTSSNGKFFEVQVKRGFRKGDDLWDALIKLAKAIVSNDINYGILVVCPDSSGTIRKDLAQDIIRMGQNRFDGIKDISIEFKSKLENEGLNVSRVCSSLYIQTVNAIEGNNDAESLAKNMLGSVSDDGEKAWQVLVENSRRIIKIKGNSTLQSCHELLKNKGITIQSGEKTSIQLFNKAHQYNKNAYAEISILSVPKPIDLQSIWIPLEAAIISDEENESLNLDLTIERYQSWYKERRNNDTIIDSFTFGRFIKKCVVIGGAGIGKTTLFRKLALDYSDEGYFVLFVKLSKLTDMLSDSSKGFEECLIDCAFDRKIQPDNISSLLQNAVILADGLDECFQQQSEITQYFSKLSKDYPESRILISTRPIGYKLGLISDWRRYELKPIDDKGFESAVKQLTSVISPEIKIDEAVLKQIEAVKISHLVKRNPLILSLVVILVKRGIEANTNYASLYRQLFSLIETESPKREVSVNLPSRQLREFLYLLGWIILRDGYKPLQELVRICHEEWKEELPLRKFEAYKVIDDCIAYWVAKGIIEKVNDLTDETVLFIHKTLGEYAAAEHLKLQNIIIQEQFILEAFSNPQYSETLTFLSHLGLSSKILALWNDTYSADNKPKNINIYDFILHAGIDYKSDEIDSFISLCWEITEDSLSTNRYTSGAILCHIATRTWDKIEFSVKKRLDSVDNWVSFIALNCNLIATKEITSKDLYTCIEKLEEIFEPIRVERFIKNRNLTKIQIKNDLIKLLIEKTLQNNNEEFLEIIETYIQKENNGLSVGLISDIIKKYSKYERSMPNYSFLEYSIFSKTMKREVAPINQAFNSEDFKKHEKTKNINFFNVIIGIGNSIDTIVLDFKKMIELSALINLSSIMEMYVQDFNVFYPNVVENDSRTFIFSSLARLNNLDYEVVLKQSNSIVSKIGKLSGDESFMYPIHKLPRVDIEFEIVNSLNIELLVCIKKLILTNERFLIANACRLFLSYPESESFEIYLGLIKDGEGLSLLYIGAMSEHYQSLENIDKIQNLFLEKLLNDNLASGCEYLYQYVIEPYNESHIQVIIKGLNSRNPIIATGATELLDKIPLNLISLDEVKELYLLWKDIEEPYPVKGGTVPHTPRENLAKILIKYNYYDEIFIQQMMLDIRPDIKKQAIQPFIDYCKDSSQLRHWLIGKVKSKEISADLLKKCITEGNFLKDSHLVLELLDNESADIRENALEILNTKYITECKMKAHAERLLSDEIIEIREYAKKILDT
ncbi:NACHT domain-containing protein [Psychrobacter sp. Ps6]|uniref:NACHT domain-containing protein n=1 Tax=Psychrobacter sp. Ps6 TaxID=2790960 RepID=UPI001EDED51C|nr:NACHT domain-containing protein [Psychrobacter sp. Ps6]MCG3878172.1 NACHT domain-containing protein [Psychrobacter sp. Ps6]